MSRTSTSLLCLAGVAALAVASCSQGGVDNSGGGNSRGTGGSSAGAGGSTAGTGGSTGGTGGSNANTGGSSAGTGGSSAGTGGATTGTGGSTTGVGGSGATGGSVGTGGAGPGTPDSGATGGSMGTGGMPDGGRGPDAGTALDINAIVPGLNGFYWEGTCSGNVTATGKNCPFADTTVTTCNTGTPTWATRGTIKNKMFTAGGTPGQPYTATIVVRGIVGTRCYTGGTIASTAVPVSTGPNNTWYAGGQQFNDSIWNTYEMHLNPAPKVRRMFTSLTPRGRTLSIQTGVRSKVRSR